MKYFLKIFVRLNLYIQIRIISIIKKPIVVLVVGGGEKSLIREKLVLLAKEKGLDYNTNFRPYNTWFGVALNFLDLPSAFSNYPKWIWIYILSWIKFFKHLIFFPKYVFLEGGIDEKGEADKFIKLLFPHVIIFASIDRQFQDDFDILNIIENEFSVFIEYINKRSKDLPIMDEEGYLGIIIDNLMENNLYFCGFNKKYEKLVNMSNKAKRKIKFIY